MKVEPIYDETTSTLTYIVFDETTKDAIVIDSVLDFNSHSSTVSFDNLNKYEDFIRKNDLKLHYILETHAHADHLSGSQYLKEKFPSAKLAINARIVEVQKTFKSIFNFDHFKANGTQFDKLLNDNEELSAGSIKIKVLYTPGHTPACTSFYINEEMVFTGDVLFMEDFGTGRCDFPEGSAKDLYHSVKTRLYTLPEETKVFVGHDYKPKGRELKYQTTIAAQKQNNIHITETTTEDEYISFRKTRDAKLNPPKLIMQSLQVNIDAGRLPQSESNGTSYLKMPIEIKK